jgi:hypothetical protein
MLYGGKSEQVIRLGAPYDLRPVARHDALASHNLGVLLRHEALVGLRVPAFVRPLVDIAAIAQQRPESAGNCDVFGIGRPHKHVRVKIECVERIAEER